MTRILIWLSLLLTPALAFGRTTASRDRDQPPASSFYELALEVDTTVRLVRMNGQEIEGKLVEMGRDEISCARRIGLRPCRNPPCFESMKS